MRLKPTGDRVVIEPLEADSTTPGGILLPDAAKEKPKRGRVLAVGPGRILPGTSGGFCRPPMTLEVGNLVCYTAYSGTEIKEDGKTVIVMSEDDVLAVEE